MDDHPLAPTPPWQPFGDLLRAGRAELEPVAPIAARNWTPRSNPVLPPLPDSAYPPGGSALEELADEAWRCRACQGLNPPEALLCEHCPGDDDEPIEEDG